MALHVGTSGWAYPAWKPTFYPEKLAQKKFLQYYSGKLNAVEVNYSFRQFIKESTLQGWIADTPKDFTFCVKAHQSITHIRRLKNADEQLKRFLDSVQPLAGAGKLGPALFQLPPNLKCDAVLLDEFCSKFPPNFRAAFEFRHESWFSDEVYRVLSRNNVALCFAESDELQTPIVVTATFSYYRLRKTEYTDDEWKATAFRLSQGVQAGRELFAFIKHEERPESALRAEELLRLGMGAAA